MKYSTSQIAAKFQEQGCELLDEYRGTMIKMKFRCRCGRIGMVSWNKFSSRGDRCGYCGKRGRVKKLTLEEARERFANNGCELLATEYRDKHAVMPCRCKCGRLTQMCLIQVDNGSHCYDCGLEKNRGPGHPQWISDREQKSERDRIRKKCYKALRSSLEAIGREKIGRTSDLLGYGPSELQDHVFNHPNYPAVKDKDWHLDHRFPITAFLKHGITDLRLMNHLSNLQPMDGSENIRKGDGYDPVAFRNWIESVVSR